MTMDPSVAAERLRTFFDCHDRVAVLTGAGCSTDSGIPDYRDDEGKWKHRRPMLYAQFVGSKANRRRYWAQSFSGWQRIASAGPNDAHRALATLERQGVVSSVVTQNVDSLHQRAGSRRVVDLHGTLRKVRCIDCGETVPRAVFQARLKEANPAWKASVAQLAPDGDAKLSNADVSSFEVPSCERCGGILKPDVVFFGESVPKARVAHCYRIVDTAEALLVVGSSLMVFSGLRFVRSASKAGKPIAILNRGATRADGLATMRLHGSCAEVLVGAAGGGATPLRAGDRTGT